MNRLNDATSPYLLQHADNPVHWWPWCEEALAVARSEDKPILLSIGYSACHWCHVMAHESFEDEATATLMNQLFINIKVDREERPDLDKIYQLAHQAIARRGGGWPLTMFLSPTDQTPFFGGTYFPPAARHGLPSFRDILTGVKRAWDDQRQALTDQNDSMREFLNDVSAVGSTSAEPELGVVGKALDGLSRIFDPQQGGFGSAPKFPHPNHIELLLAAAQGPAAERCRKMAETTLLKMSRGGIHDQIGGGFCRYSVDGHWMIPHFEKMGYDNAQLLPLYAAAATADENDEFRRTALSTADWVMRELQDEQGGYYSSWDADSEGEEGRFYVWPKDQVKALLNDEEYQVVAPLWGLDRPANFEGHAWHLHVFEDRATLSQRLGLSSAQVAQRIESARVKLIRERSTRVPPGRDDKILASWNGLMILGMANAGRRLGQSELVHSAQRAADFLRQHMTRDGRLLASFRKGQAHLNAYLDDYAFVAFGLTELLQADWRESDLEFAIQLVDALLEHFEDAEHGGFLFTSHDHEPLIQRPRPFQDEALPAGNAIAARVLLRLGHLLAEPRYLNAAEKTLRVAWAEVEQIPHAYSSLLLAALDWLDPSDQIILRGDHGDLIGTLTNRLGTRATVYAIPEDSRLAQRFAMTGAFTAYRCSGPQCSAPSDSVEEVIEWTAALPTAG